jgi:Fe-S-cluster-containing hydrogenase component 2
MPSVIPSRCPQNHPCPLVFLCPVGAIAQRGFAAPEIDPDECIDCGACSVSCAYGAVIEDVRPADGCPSCSGA